MKLIKMKILGLNQTNKVENTSNMYNKIDTDTKLNTLTNQDSTDAKENDYKNTKKLTNKDSTETTENNNKNTKTLENNNNTTIKKRVLQTMNHETAVFDKVAIDTAAGIHLVHTKEWLQEYGTIVNAPEYYGAGDDENPLLIPGKGILPIKISQTEVRGVEAYYCPQQDATIISADKLYNETGITLDRGYKSLVGEETDFDADTFKTGNTVWVDADKIISFKPINHNSNQKVNDHIIRAISPPNPLNRKHNVSLIEAHLRLNHFPAKGIIKSIKMNNFDDVSAITDTKLSMKLWCEICASGRIHRHFHYTGSMNHYSSQKLPGSSWSLDVFGPVPHVKERYMLIMIDSVSRFMIVTTHSKKTQNEIGTQIEKNIKWIEKQFDTQVKELLMDRGKEFDNQIVESMASREGISIIYTSTEDHAANSRSERGIRTIIEDTRTLLLQSRLPLRFWTYAARAAANVRNCLYNKNVGESPLLNLSNHKTKINLRSFLPFGAPAMIKDHTIHKTRAPGKKAITLAKDPKGYGYHFYIPKDRKIISTTNYVLPDYTIDHSVKAKDNQQDIIGTFLEEIKEKIGDVNDTDFNEDEIVKSLPLDVDDNDDEDSDDDDIEFDTDEVRIAKYLIENDPLEVNNEEPYIDPRNIDNINLDELFQDIKVEEDEVAAEPEEEYNTTVNDDEVEEKEFVTEPEKNISINDDDSEMIEEEHINESEEDISNNIDDSKSLIEDNNHEQYPLLTENTIDDSSLPNEYLTIEHQNVDQTDRNNDISDDPDYTPNEHDSEDDDLVDAHEKVDIDGDELLELKLDAVMQHSDTVEENNFSDEEEVFRDIKKRFTADNRVTKPKTIIKPTTEQITTEYKAMMKAMNINLDEDKNNSNISTNIFNKSNHITTTDTIGNHVNSTVETEINQPIHVEHEDHDESDDEFFDTNELHKDIDQTKTKHEMISQANKWMDKNFQSITKKPKSTINTRLLDETIKSGNINEIPKINLNSLVDKNDEPHPKRVVKTKKFIRFIHTQFGWQDYLIESDGYFKVSRVIRALFYKDAITTNTDLEAKTKFIEAYNAELTNLVNMGVIDLNVKIEKTKIPKNKLIPLNSIFDIKRSGVYKARIVCRGDQQDPTSYNDIETAILNMDSLKILLILSNNSNMKLRTLDINHAFLYADLEEELYVVHPQDKRKATPLRKALYGLRQSPRCWNETFKEFMNSIGLYDNVYSPGFYVSKNKKIMVAAYVDDCILAAENDEELDKIEQILRDRFSLKIVGVMKENKLDTDILGMDLHYDYNEGTITLGMKSYITRLKEQYPDIINNDMKNMELPHVTTYEINPKEDELILEKKDYKKRVKYLQELIGKLNYIRSRGRIDIEFAVGKVARLVLYPHDKVIKAAEKILKYVYSTRDVEMTFQREHINNNYTITVVCDASLASEYDLKSRAGGIIWLGSNFFHGFSKKSSIICESSAEAELDAINTGDKLALLLKLKLEKLTGQHTVEINLITDSKPALDWLKQDYFKARTKFLGLRIERLKERLNDKQLIVRKIKGLDNTADPLTKPVAKKDFEKLVQVLQHQLTSQVLLPITVPW